MAVLFIAQSHFLFDSLFDSLFDASFTHKAPFSWPPPSPRAVAQRRVRVVRPCKRVRARTGGEAARCTRARDKRHILWVMGPHHSAKQPKQAKNSAKQPILAKNSLFCRR
jgi:hypothetical protein